MKFKHEIIDQLLDNLFPLPEQFGLDCSEGADELPNYWAIKDSLREVDKNVRIYYGMSKLVILPSKAKDIVIKIPFNGYYRDSLEWLEGEGEEVEEWCDFYFATGSDPADYCLTEYEKFKNLKKRHLDSFVAETIFYREVDGVKVFIQERVIPFESCDRSSNKPSRKSKVVAREWRMQGKHYMNSNWVANCIDYYGEKRTEHFFFYCENFDEDITHDLHSGNFGYRKDGSPVLLDYSGFDS